MNPACRSGIATFSMSIRYPGKGGNITFFASKGLFPAIFQTRDESGCKTFRCPACHLQVVYLKTGMETANRFSEIIKGEKPVLVDFYADWCGPCKMMTPILKELKSKMQDKITILKIDVDKNPQAANAYQVQGIPTLILFQHGQIKWRQSGVVNAAQLEQVLKQQTN
jgi:thioredoxin 1